VATLCKQEYKLLLPISWSFVPWSSTTPWVQNNNSILPLERENPVRDEEDRLV
jgi:hypothetical protein